MLDAYIIDAIRREEEDKEQRDFERRRVWLEIPIYRRDPPPPPSREEHEPERGPIVIPLDGEIEEDAA